MIPQIVFHKAISGFLKILKSDYQSATDKSKTILSYYLGGVVFGKYNFFNEGKTLFLPQQTEREISVVLGYDTEREGKPSIHVMLGSEDEQHQPLGAGELAQFVELDSVTYSQKWRGIGTRINVLITSDNAFEVVLIFEVVKKFLFSVTDQLSTIGFHNAKVSAQDLTLNSETTLQAYHRMITISGVYECASLGTPVPANTTSIAFQALLETNLSYYVTD